jgi:hypothetical protein
MKELGAGPEAPPGEQTSVLARLTPSPTSASSFAANFSHLL